MKPASSAETSGVKAQPGSMPILLQTPGRMLVIWLCAYAFTPGAVNAQAPTDDQIKSMEQEIQQVEAAQAEARKRAEIASRRKEEEKKRQAEEEAMRAASEQAAKLKLEEDERKKKEEIEKAERLRDEEASRRIVVYLESGVREYKYKLVGFTFEVGRCFSQNLESSLSPQFSTIKFVKDPRISVDDQREVKYLLKVEELSAREEEMGFQLFKFSVMNSFALHLSDGKLIDRYQIVNSSTLDTSSFSSVPVIREGLCNSARDNVVELLTKMQAHLPKAE